MNQIIISNLLTCPSGRMPKYLQGYFQNIPAGFQAAFKLYMQIVHPNNSALTVNKESTQHWKSSKEIFTELTLYIKNNYQHFFVDRSSSRAANFLRKPV